MPTIMTGEVNELKSPCLIALVNVSFKLAEKQV